MFLMFCTQAVKTQCNVVQKYSRLCLKAAKAWDKAGSDGYAGKYGTWLRGGVLPFAIVTLLRVGQSKLMELL